MLRKFSPAGKYKFCGRAADQSECLSNVDIGRLGAYRESLSGWEHDRIG